MKNVIAYIRVSTRNQFKKGLSLDVQMQEIRALTKGNEMKIVAVRCDGASAQNEDNVSVRPGLNKAVEAALKYDRPIIAASADRFSRSVNAYDRFIRDGGKLYVADLGFSANGAAMRNAIVRAQALGKGISGRTRAGLELAKERGVPLGNPRLEDARAASVIVRRANAAAASEEFRDEYRQTRGGDTLSARQVAEAFNKSGYSTTRGEKWTGPNVRRMLRDLRAADKAADLASREMVVDLEGSEAAIVDADRRLTPYALSLFRAAAAAKGIEQQKADHFCQRVMGRVLSSAGAGSVKAWIANAYKT